VLAVRPSNPDVVVDVGLSYFLQNPPDYEPALREFRRALEIDPNHEKTLQFAIQTLIKQNKSSEASEYLERLRTVNPRNESIPELTSMLANSQPSG
jgi:tetratricopeptide (TPR) repeat protein